MNDTKIIDKLKRKGILFAKGLTPEEIDEVQERYNITFPPDLKDFLSSALPLSHNFVNWRDTSKENIASIYARIDWPLEGMLFDIENNVFWYDGWGEKPDSLEDAFNICKEEFKKVPKLIPICSHRYIPSEPNEAGNPIFSVYQTDIIYYGEDLTSYLEIEFGFKKYERMNFSSIKDIRFWIDLQG
ncbi:SMI1/KNR4 family protein [Cellulosilyticum sp. I15G10I2]|uniref:SMI1/KNR4 family protein n=1 Tax=Cellulosilyticum sp. I15G10I2 TaxID=1892843 RepID=UPI00085C751E|nr:SMI1/KNR4 family protein [Cellulosilyticum sp. I15G10I2]